MIYIRLFRHRKTFLFDGWLDKRSCGIRSLSYLNRYFTVYCHVPTSNETEQLNMSTLDTPICESRMNYSWVCGDTEYFVHFLGNHKARLDSLKLNLHCKST